MKITSDFELSDLTLKDGKTVGKISFIIPDYPVIPTVVTPPVIPPVVVIPPGQTVVFKIGDNLKNIEQVSSGKLVKIESGTFQAPVINVPVGVSIEGAGQDKTIIVCTTPGNAGQTNEVGLFDLKSTTRVNGNQIISKLTVDGKDVAFAGALCENRDNVKLLNLTVRNFNFTGGWVRSAKDNEIKGCTFHNTGWADTRFSSGQILIAGVENLTIDSNLITSDKDNQGCGIEGLWKTDAKKIPYTLTNLKIINNVFKLSHQAPWAGGQANNFSVELHDTNYNGIEISGNDFGNGLSLASHMRGNGAKTKVFNNKGNLGGDRVFVEMICDDLEVYGNNITGAMMLAANMQPNSKWKNLYFHHNTFESAGLLSYGAIFLIGKEGVENMRVENNTITLKGNKLVAYMGATATGVTLGTNTIK